MHRARWSSTKCPRSATHKVVGVLFVAALFAAPGFAQEAVEEDEDAPRTRRRAKTEQTERSSRREAPPAQVSSSISPQGKQFGIGLQLGAPTALTLKYMVTGDQALVAGLGAGIGWDPSISLHVDYVWHPTVLASMGWGSLSWFIGGGGWLSFSGGNYGNGRWGPQYYGYLYTVSPFALGARLPIGLDLAFSQVPIEVYLEADPMLVLFPRIAFGLGGTLGGRFYF